MNLNVRWLKWIVVPGLLLWALSQGSTPINWLDWWREWGQNGSAPTHWIVWQWRLPRVLLGLLVGAALAMSGAVMQGLFRNPLADPSLVGVSSGAALMAASVMALMPWLEWSAWPWLYGTLMPMAAFAGGLFSTWLIYRLATDQGHTRVSLMLLAGIAMNALVLAGIGLLSYFADNTLLRSLTFWQLGSLADVRWMDLVWLSPLLLWVSWRFWRLGQPLNLWQLGEATAQQSGVDVRDLKRWSIGLTALSVGAVVSMVGMIGFVGLIAPHLVRLILGVDHRQVIPVSAVLGGLLVVVADAFARSWLAPVELPIGLLLSLVGAPFFLWLLWQQRAQF